MVVGPGAVIRATGAQKEYGRLGTGFSEGFRYGMAFVLSAKMRGDNQPGQSGGKSLQRLQRFCYGVRSNDVVLGCFQEKLPGGEAVFGFFLSH